MAITTYTQLKTQLLRFIHRDDFDEDFDVFLGMMETEIFNNPVKTLDSNFLEVSTQLVSINGSNEFDLPIDFMTMRDFRIQQNGQSSKISYKAPSQQGLRGGTGMPSTYTIFADKIRLDVTPDEIKTFDLDYVKEFAGLTEANPTNEVLLNNPNIYFFGCMWAAKILEEEIQDSQMYYSQLINAIKGSNKKARRARYGSGASMGYNFDNEQLNKL